MNMKDCWSLTCRFSWTLGSLLRCGQLYRYYFGRCSSELAQLVSLPFSWGRFPHYSDRLYDFSVVIPRCYKDVYFNHFFPHTARLWNSLPIECFQTDFLYALIFRCSFFFKLHASQWLLSLAWSESQLRKKIIWSRYVWCVKNQMLLLVAKLGFSISSKSYPNLSLI